MMAMMAILGIWDHSIENYVEAPTLSLSSEFEAA